MDGDVGRLMALLKDLGIDGQTLVVFTSDNGAGWNDTRFRHSGALRGMKRDLYEGGIRTPAIARWPGHVPAGVVSDQVWAFSDVLPTLADLTGQPTPPGLDGVSILPTLLDGKPVSHPPLYWEFHERGFDQAARMGDWKAVKNGLNGSVELFDLKSDPAEAHDLAAQNPDVVKRIESFLKTARVDSAVWPVRQNSAARKAQRKTGAK
jgi:arylsulfatase A-like enzyme